MLIEDEQKWLREFFLYRLNLYQIKTILSDAGHPYDYVAPCGMSLEDSLPLIVKEASNKGWDLKLVEILIEYVKSKFEGITQDQVLYDLAEIKKRILDRQAQGTGLSNSSTSSETIINKTSLRQAIIKAFSIEDLELLCADIEQSLAEDGIDLPVNLEVVGGEGKPVKVLKLIGY